MANCDSVRRNELQAHDAVEQMKQISGTYREIELVRSDSRWGSRGPRVWTSHEAGQPQMSRDRTNGSCDFTIYVALLSEAYKTIPVGKLSPLQEDEARYYTTAVVNKTKDRLKLATVSWLKESFESWRARTENQMRSCDGSASGNYTLPRILDGTGGCSDYTWTATSAA